MKQTLPTGATLLFQGDSITDCGRARDAAGPNGGLGGGYASLIAARLLAAHPEKNLSIYNRGISGNRILDLAARIRGDVINLKPDVLSILIGVNDTWHEFNYQNGVPVPKYQRLYREFLAEVRAALPKARFVLCEPFVLSCGVVTGAWVAEMNERRAVVAGLAKEFDAVWVPFQTLFDDSLRQAPPAYWAADGVHPTLAGHQRMADQWLAATGLIE
ncbi:MAG: SGNH/GDSL hydrolase family protein [Spirochaetes bacterium]|nr:SGNH/GDSL hydrolase family protein [Spirochaetota bacterium]